MIIFLSGTINSGKSTISKLLQKSLGNTAIVEIDLLRQCIDWLPLEQSIPINLKNAISLIKNFVNEGFHVVVPYPLSQKNYEFLACELADINQEILFFTLAPKLESVLNNRGGRELTAWEKERIRYHYNTNMTPEETTEEILRQL